MNIEAPTNFPIGRWTYTNWQDANDNLYIFAGYTMDSIINWNSITDYEGELNDLWRYNTTNNMWTWIGGDSGVNAYGQYTEACVVNSASVPSALMENKTTQTHNCSDVFWTFGGMGNYLWAYIPQSKKWILVDGTITNPNNGVYGTINIPSTDNMPPGRLGECFWSDTSGTLWAWSGGTQIGGGDIFNDMWKFVPDLSCLKLICDMSTSDLYTMATAFTPNGDSKNDLFYPVFSDTASISVIRFDIYNRWEQLVYNNPTMGWDGRYKGEPQPEGIYTYFVTVSLPDVTNPGHMKEISREGSFALMR